MKPHVGASTPPSRGDVLMLLLTSLLNDGRVQREARSLSAHGYRVTILTVRDHVAESGMNDAEREWQRCADTLAGIEIAPLQLSTARWPRLLGPLRRLGQLVELALRSLPVLMRKRWTVVHSHELRPMALAMVTAAIHGSLIVYDAHELEVSPTDTGKKPFRLLYELASLRLASAVMTVNDEIRDILSSRTRRTVHVVRNLPAHVPESALRTGRIRESLGLPTDAFLVGYAGNVVPHERGIEVVVAALAHLPSRFFFCVLGVGRVAEFRLWLSQQAYGQGEHMSRVLFLPGVPPDDVPIAISDFDVSVMLYSGRTQNEVINSPNKLYQSLLARTPILASNNVTFPRIVLHSEAGPVGRVCDPTDVSAVSEALRGMAEHDDLQEFSRNAAVLAAANSWSQSETTLLHMYAQMTSP